MLLVLNKIYIYICISLLQNINLDTFFIYSDTQKSKSQLVYVKDHVLIGQREI